MIDDFTLEHLAVLFGGEQSLRSVLDPFHEIRSEGIFVVDEWLDADARRRYSINGRDLCPPGRGITEPVLKAQFTEIDFLQFMAIRPDMAWELERAYTDDDPDTEADDAAAAPRQVPRLLDEKALMDLDALVPAFADMLRRRLPARGQWYAINDTKFAPQREQEEESASTAAVQRPAPASASSQATVTPPSPAATAVHKVGRYNLPLTAVIKQAERKAADSNDWQSVWAALADVATSPSRPAPLLGYVESEGVKYQTDNATQPVAYLSREAFRKRFARVRGRG